MVVYPDLAAQLGLDEAVFIAQLDYWLKRSKNIRIEDGCRWIWNTVSQWLEQFSWLSRSKLERLIAKLERLGIVLSQKFWKQNWNHTKWYRLDYKKLQEDYGWMPADKTEQKAPQSSETEPVKIPESVLSNRGNRSRQFDGIITEITSQEITSKDHTLKEEDSACDFFNSEEEEKAQNPQTLLDATEVKESSRQTLPSLGEKPTITVEPKDLDRDKIFRRPVTREIQKLQNELLNNPVFIQWWIDRVEKSDFVVKLIKPPRAYVLGEIRNKPETVIDMFDCFQTEVTSRVESFNLRQRQDFDLRQQYRNYGGLITPEQREQIQSIAPYSIVPLEPEPKLLTPSKSIILATVVGETVPCSTIPPEVKAKVQEHFRQAAERKANQNQGRFRPAASDQNPKDYNEADHLGSPNPAEFEGFQTSREDQSP